MNGEVWCDMGVGGGLWCVGCRNILLEMGVGREEVWVKKQSEVFPLWTGKGIK